MMELATTQIEGTAGHPWGRAVCRPARPPRLHPRVEYPGRLPTSKRTPLLSDGTESALAVTADGGVHGEINRWSLPQLERGRTLDAFDSFPGISSALTAAGSAAFHGIGVYLRSDRSIWMFDDGEPLSIRRTARSKSIAVNSFARWLASLGGTSPETATVLAQAVMLASIQGTGAMFAVAPAGSSLQDVISSQDLVPSEAPIAKGRVREPQPLAPCHSG